MQIFKIGLAKT